MFAHLDPTEAPDDADDGDSGSADASAPDDPTAPGDGPRPDGGLATTAVDATFELPTDAGTARMSVPESATPDEAAAVAAALASHIAEEDDEPGSEAVADPWVLAGRLGCRRRSELPRACPPDGAWKAAARFRR